MALVFDITHLGPYLPDEPNGKWIAANAVKVNAGYNLRFMHPDGWILKDYRVFQVDPNEDGSKPVLTATKTAAPEGSPARPAIGQKEVLAPNPVNNGNTVGSAVDTKRKIMK